MTKALVLRPDLAAGRSAGVLDSPSKTAKVLANESVCFYLGLCRTRTGPHRARTCGDGAPLHALADSHFASGKTPAALRANWRSHADKSNPSFAAASRSACFCSPVMRIRTTSSFLAFAAGCGGFGFSLSFGTPSAL